MTNQQIDQHRNMLDQADGFLATAQPGAGFDWSKWLQLIGPIVINILQQLLTPANVNPPPAQQVAGKASPQPQVPPGH